VGRDGRRLSEEFALDTTSVLAGAGIPVHVFPDVVPTPVGAYAVTELGAAAGVIITASHNPPADNGYKVYWGNGAQIIPPHDRGISAAVDRIHGDVPFLPPAEAAVRGRLRGIGPELGERYLDRALALRRHPEVPPEVRVAYTPLHGVGGRWVRDLLGRAGYRSLFTVPEQAEPDGEFPTVSFPNPEERGAMDLVLALAERESCDLVLANDPDADRLAVAVRDEGGVYRTLTGNEIGLLLAYYLLTENPPAGEKLVATTIVSSSLLSRMAGELGVHYAETLTGFKWLATKALDMKARHGWTFVMGFEEALGYSVGELVRDKDGISAALLFAEMAAFCRARGRTLLHYLGDLHRRFGLYASRQVSVTLPGAEGSARIRGVMEAFRTAPLRQVAGVEVAALSDVSTGERRDLATGTSSRLDLPASDVLVYELADRSRILLRPSGTEPKIKYYFEVVEPPGEAYRETRARAEARLDRLTAAFRAEAERRTPR
jgi:phosphomannomutase